MTKSWLVGLTAFAMMSGVALAQSSTSDVTTSTQTTTTTPVPLIGSYSTTKTQKTIDSDGNQTDKSHTYTSGSNGTTSSTTKKTMTEDGSQTSTSHEEQTANPRGDTTSNYSTTTKTRD